MGGWIGSREIEIYIPRRIKSLSILDLQTDENTHSFLQELRTFLLDRLHLPKNPASLQNWRIACFKLYI